MTKKAMLRLLAATFCLAPLLGNGAESADGVAVAIVYDTSGSMRDNVRDASGKLTPKYRIANRALEAIAHQLQAFVTNAPAGSPRNLHVGLFTFDGKGTREVVKFGPFDEGALVAFAKKFSTPGSGTPLGTALDQASRTVLNSPFTRKHVLVLTDGMNTVGPDPAKVLPGLKQKAERKQTGLAVHFVAFDVDAKVFDPVKKLGATVVGAADEPQLNARLDYILQRKILLEEEEVPAKKN